MKAADHCWHVLQRFLIVIQQHVRFPTSIQALLASSLSRGFPFPLRILLLPRFQVAIRAVPTYQLIPEQSRGEKKEATEEIRGRGVRNSVNVILCLSA